jgi:ferrochelatase
VKGAILLVNLGSPASPSVADVRRYLDEFLMDPYVLDLPFPLRAAVVKGFILNSRPAKSARAYAKIWWPEGSPLVVISERQRAALEVRSGLPVGLAMRYGEPSIENGIDELLARTGGVDELAVAVLYPQYSLAATKTAEVAVAHALTKRGVAHRFVPPFFNDPGYLDALAALMRRVYPPNTQYVLFSYHGIPKRHLRKADPTGSHCLSGGTCCAMPSPAHAACYRHQAIETTTALTQRLGLRAGQYGLSFQSRLGGGWLEPFTDVELAELPSRGIKRLVAVSPSFVTDCLETLEAMARRGKETFMAAGGESYTYVPCLNEDPRWIAALAGLCHARAAVSA